MKKIFCLLAFVFLFWGNLASAFNGPDIVIEKVRLVSAHDLHVTFMNIGNEPLNVTDFRVDHTWYDGNVNESTRETVRQSSYSDYITNQLGQTLAPGESKEIVLDTSRDAFQNSLRIEISSHLWSGSENAANNIFWRQNATDLVIESVELTSSRDLQITIKNSGIVSVYIPYGIQANYGWFESGMNENSPEVASSTPISNVIEVGGSGLILAPGESLKGTLRSPGNSSGNVLRVQIDKDRRLVGENYENNIRWVRNIEDLIIEKVKLVPVEGLPNNYDANITVKNIGVVPYNITEYARIYYGWYSAEVAETEESVRQGHQTTLTNDSGFALAPGKSKTFLVRGIGTKPRDRNFLRVELDLDYLARGAGEEKEFRGNNVLWTEFKPDLAVVGIDFKLNGDYDVSVRNVGNVTAVVPNDDDDAQIRLRWYEGYVNGSSHNIVGTSSISHGMGSPEGVKIKENETKKYTISGHRRPNGYDTLKAEIYIYSRFLPDADANPENNIFWKMYVAPGVTGEELAGVDEDQMADEIVGQSGEADPSVPGDFSYFVKDFVRDLNWTFTLDSGKQVEISLRYANEKIIEVNKLIEQGKEDKIASLIASYSKDIERANIASRRLKGKDREKAEELIGRAVSFQIRHQVLLAKFIRETSPEVSKAIKDAQNNVLVNVGEMLDGISSDRATEIMSDAVGGSGSPFRSAREYDVLENIKNSAPESARGAISSVQEDSLANFRDQFEDLNKGQKDLIVDYAKTSDIFTSQFSRDIAEEIPSIGQMIKEAEKRDLEIEIPKPADTHSQSFEIEKPKKDITTIPVPSVPTPAPIKEINKDISNDIFCISLYDPVCGTDGTTYANDCEAKRSGVTVASKGKCQNMEINIPTPSLPEITIPEMPSFDIPIPEPTIPAPTPAPTPVPTPSPAPVVEEEIVRNPSFTMSVTKDDRTTYTVNGVIEYYGKGRNCAGPRTTDNPVVIRWGDSASTPTVVNGKFTASHQYHVKNSSYLITVGVYSSCYGMTSKTELVHPDF